jgi:hypothetical protein
LEAEYREGHGPKAGRNLIEEHLSVIIVSAKKMIFLLRAKSFCFVEKLVGLYSPHPPCTTALFVVHIYH